MEERRIKGETTQTGGQTVGRKMDDRVDDSERESARREWKRTGFVMGRKGEKILVRQGDYVRKPTGCCRVGRQVRTSR